MRAVELLVDALAASGWRLLSLVQSPGCAQEGDDLSRATGSFTNTLLSLLRADGALGEGVDKAQAGGHFHQPWKTRRGAEEKPVVLGCPSDGAAFYPGEGREAEADRIPATVTGERSLAGNGCNEARQAKVAAVPNAPSREGGEKGVTLDPVGGAPEGRAGRCTASGDVEALRWARDHGGEEERGILHLGSERLQRTRYGGDDPAAPREGPVPSPAFSAVPLRGGGTEMASRDLGLLDPTFRQRLIRVMERMEREAGYQVELVEGYRSPERQEALFRQGRTEPGRVVTWTRNSLHSRGRAADLLVNGRWDYHEGYEVLQRIAREEGLQTLGPRDPGHLELRGGEGGAGNGRGAKVLRGPVPRTAHPHRVALPAAAAEPLGSESSPPAPAPVAKVADVAFSQPAGCVPGQAAKVASEEPGRSHGAGVRGALSVGLWAKLPSSPYRITLPQGEAGPPPDPPDHSVSVPDPRGRSQSPAAGGLAKGGGEPPRQPEPPLVGAGLSPGKGVREGGGPAEVQDSESARGWGLRPSPQRGVDALWQGLTNSLGVIASQSSGSVRGELGWGVEVTGPRTVDRALELAEIREAGETAGRLHVELQDLDGEGTRLRLALRGGRLDGFLELQDPLAVARMRLRVGELHEALLRHGLDGRNLAVRGPGEEGDSGGAVRRGTPSQEGSWNLRGGGPWHRERGKERT